MFPWFLAGHGTLSTVLTPRARPRDEPKHRRSARRQKDEGLSQNLPVHHASSRLGEEGFDEASLDAGDRTLIGSEPDLDKALKILKGMKLTVSRF